MLDQNIKNKILAAQKNEITEHHIYNRLAASNKNPKNKEILKHIANDELGHYNFWKKYTQTEVKPSTFNIWKYFLISKIFGVTFGIKLMENGEKGAQIMYQQILAAVPETQSVINDEHEHEQQLINLLDEEKLKYVGSIVLGLSDALVELTGALAGFTLALQNTKLIAMTGLIIGIAASFSMAASEYLATKSEGGEKHPLKASVYTGIAYILVVIFLILPYLIFSNLYLALGLTILAAVIIIFTFTFYTSVAQDLSFKKKFLEMAVISLGIATLSFGIGFLVRIFFDIEI